MAGTDGLERLEKLCWHLSGWQVDQCSVDRLMTEIRAYVQTHTPEASAMLAVRLPEALQEPVTAEPSPPDPIVPQESTRGRVRPMVPGGDGPSRTCRTCHGYWALEEYDRDTKGVGGRKSVCRLCENRRKRERRREQAVLRKAARITAQKAARAC
jgi:hypothetical protein